jgi:hypothetical protein
MTDVSLDDGPEMSPPASRTAAMIDAAITVSWTWKRRTYASDEDWDDGIA